MYDLFVLTFNEKRRSRLKINRICTKALNKHGQARSKYYHELWPFINNCYGILYKLFTREGLGTYECCDEIFDFSNDNNADLFQQSFIPNIPEGCVEDWVSIKLNADYKEEFIAVFYHLLSCSPTSTVAFLCRGQSVDKEVVAGTLSYEEFIKMLCSGDIKTNICYLVRCDLSA